MEPSSSTISHRTDTGSKPASTVRSTEASVCPALFKTPPSLYFSGKIWPGRLKSAGVESLDASAKTVVALS
ncbi:bifunctional riboflavin biosynthesis protein RIBA 1, chloroplastic [Trifolium repens]|nr:bifunctional riboflavin biosynthesis protein RIBA 1, chloroplastic [Trifolium repens]